MVGFGRGRNSGPPSLWSEGNAPRVSVLSKVFVQMNGQWVNRGQPPSEQDYTGLGTTQVTFGSHQLTCHYNKDISPSEYRSPQLDILMFRTQSQPHKKQRTRISGPFWTE